MQKKKQNFVYDQLAQFYDKSISLSIFNTYKAIIGNVTDKYIFDLGCGTGTLLKHFSKNNHTFGVDISSEMIKVARKKGKKTEYFIQDIKNFNVDKNFDIIICAYDTINHLSGFNNWKKLFKNVFEKLHDNGIFVFDFNTIQGFEKYSNKIILKKIKNNFLFRQVKTEKNRCYWSFDIFVRKPKNLYKYQKIVIKEYSYSNKIIINELKKYFLVIHIIKEKNNRIFIKAKKKGALMFKDAISNGCSTYCKIASISDCSANVNFF